MMQVQKGQVKYKDRSDIICTYGINDAGKQYYFLDGEKLGNGSYIASTALVEAIDPLVVASNVGVISSVGEVVVPFDNKSIKPITAAAILVEKGIPSTQSVIDAVNMRKDPLAATKLVTTPATIKDRMNAKMGNGGRFVFNDQFSEASVFDLDGNNLLNNEYYSFIGLNNGTLYMSKNTVESEIVEYKLVKEEVKPVQEELLDVQDAKVAPAVIDNAMQNAVAAPSVPPVAPEVPPVAPEVSVAPVVPQVVSTPAVPKVEAQPVVPAVAPTEESEKLHPVNFQALEKTEDFDGAAKEKAAEPENTFIPKKETRVSLFEGLKFEEESGNNKVTDSNKSDEKNDSIISDTAALLTKLIKKNKEQRDKLAANETKINELLTFKRQAFDENQALVKENDDLKKRIKELETELNSKSDKLENLNAQVAQTDDLAKLLEDAKSLLDE